MTKYEKGEAILIVVLDAALVILKNWKKLRGLLHKKTTKLKTE